MLDSLHDERPAAYGENRARDRPVTQRRAARRAAPERRIRRQGGSREGDDARPSSEATASQINKRHVPNDARPQLAHSRRSASRNRGRPRPLPPAIRRSGGRWRRVPLVLASAPRLTAADSVERRRPHTERQHRTPGAAAMRLRRNGISAPARRRIRYPALSAVSLEVFGVVSERRGTGARTSICPEAPIGLHALVGAISPHHQALTRPPLRWGRPVAG